MKHQEFPVKGYEFMNEPATDAQKQIVADLCKKRGTPIDPNGEWPEPFSKWDAANMIAILREELGLNPEATIKVQTSSTYGQPGGK
jgi:hypothetical protein